MISLILLSTTFVHISLKHIPRLNFADKQRNSVAYALNSLLSRSCLGLKLTIPLGWMAGNQPQ